jgi:hypothetical protein
MEKVYYLCEFEYGASGQFFQEVENGVVLRLVNLDGSDIVIEGDYGYNIINTEPISNPF